MRKRLRILKLKLISWFGFKLTANEKAELNYWITLHSDGKLTKSTSKALRKLRKGKYVILDDDCRCELIRYLVRSININKELLRKVHDEVVEDI